MCDGIVPIMYLRSIVGSKPNLNWYKLVTVVAEESEFICIKSLCMQPEQVSNKTK